MVPRETRLISIIGCLVTIAGIAAAAEPLALEDFRIRDPFVLPLSEEGRYYLYGTSVHLPEGTGVDVYTSTDLAEWQGPSPAFRPEPDFWATRNFWAPEVHEWRDRYYMFASFKSDDRMRATQILASDHPAGPFTVHSPEPITPPDWECLDGTLYVDDNGKPWIVFCHEWVQIGDGAMCAVRMTEDLKAPMGEPITLFHAGDADWVHDVREGGPWKVTDGPWLIRAANGHLLMLWSSFGKGGYTLAVARSRSGQLEGPWDHDHPPLFRKDGGHAMTFKSFEGRRLLSLHQPNKHPDERARLFEVTETDGELSLKSYLPATKTTP